MDSIYVINYGTTPYFENSKGDKYYCKSIKSTKKLILELLNKDLKNLGTEGKFAIKEALEPLERFILNLKTCSFPGTIPNLEFHNKTKRKGGYNDLYIGIKKENLY